MSIYEETIRGYKHILHGGDYNPDQWLETPEIIDEDFRLMKLSGCNAFSVGIFSWTSYEKTEGVFTFDWLDKIMDRLAENNFKAFLATPSGAKPAWLALKYPEICRVDSNGKREPYRGRHNHCYLSPVYREKVNIINTKLAERYAKHPALGGWHVSNEYSGAPACYCPLCLKGFQDFLKLRYGTLDELNKAWWGPFWNHIYTDWLEINPHDYSDSLNVDVKRYITEQCVDFMKHEIAPLKRITPDKPVTTNMMGFYGELNYWRIAEVCDFISDDCYPEWYDEKTYPMITSRVSIRHDMHRAMKGGKPFIMLESTPSATNWALYHKLKRPGIHKAEMLNALAHGADGVMYFQWRKSQGNLEKFHGAVVDHVGTENTRVFNEVAEVGKLCSKLDDLVGTACPAETALVYDWESLWNLNFSGGPTQNNKKYIASTIDHYNALWQMSVPVDVIHPDSDLSAYKMLVIPMLFMFRKGYADKVKEFIRNGGTAVMTYMSAYVNETGKCFLGGWPGDGLREVFGIWNEELDGFDPSVNQTIVMEKDNDLSFSGEFKVVEMAERIHAEGAEVLARYGHDFYAGEPVVTVNSFGKGKAYYIAARTGDDFLYDFYFALTRVAGISKLLGEQKYPCGVHASVRTDGKNTFLFLLNMSCEEAAVTLPDGKFSDVETEETYSKTIKLEKHRSLVLRKK